MTLSFVKAAVAVLEAAGQPLHYKEIAQRAIDLGFLKTEGKTPEATLNALIAVDIKQNREESIFVRIEPGIFGLSQWVREESPANGTKSFVPKHLSGEPGDRRVCVPHFPSYSEVRTLLPIWADHPKQQVTALRGAVVNLCGSPQSPVDWTNPDEWIPERLGNGDRELAEQIWQESKGTVNPRHTYGHWLLANTYNLLAEDDRGALALTEFGQDFLDNPQGRTVLAIDEREGLLKLLQIVAEKGVGRRSVFLPEWAAYLANYSSYKTDSTIKDTLWRRLYNLVDRELVSKKGISYSITELGLRYLQSTEGAGETSGSEEVQEILSLVKAQEINVRTSIRELLETMNPQAFEYLIKQVLEAMNYQNVKVTSLSNDKGVDVVADIELGITSVREVVQAKRQKNNVQRTVLDALRGSLHRFQAVRGTIITTANFSKGATQAAFESGAAPITLINGDKLVDLLIENDLGIAKRKIEVLELDEAFFAKSIDELEE